MNTLQFPESLIVNRTVEPTEYPVTLAELKAHLLVTGTTDDTLLTSILETAIKEAEEITGKQLALATYATKLDNFPSSDHIVLYRPPLVSVTSITYVDTAGATQTLSTNVYAVDTASQPGRVSLKYDQSWPTDCRGHYNDVTITYVAGYSSASVVTVVGSGGGENVPDGDYTPDGSTYLSIPIYLNNTLGYRIVFVTFDATALRWILYPIINIGVPTIYWEGGADNTDPDGAYTAAGTGVGTATVTLTTTSSVPEMIKSGIKLLAQAQYDPIRSGNVDETKTMRDAAINLLLMERCQGL